jgi:hypothetical protein
LRVWTRFIWLRIGSSGEWVTVEVSCEVLQSLPENARTDRHTGLGRFLQNPYALTVHHPVHNSPNVRVK